MFDLDDLIADCTAALAEAQPVLAVKEIVERAMERPSSIDAVLGEPTTGGMRALHHTGDLTIMQFVWPPGVVLFPHDHRMWAANGIYGGREDNTFYRRVGDHLEVSGGTQLDAGHVAVLGKEAIHSVVNPKRSYTAAIHVYGGDFFGTPRSQWADGNDREGAFDADVVRQLLADADEHAKADAAIDG